MSLKCDSCGAPLKGLPKCEYCGSIPEPSTSEPQIVGGTASVVFDNWKGKHEHELIDWIKTALKTNGYGVDSGYLWYFNAYKYTPVKRTRGIINRKEYTEDVGHTVAQFDTRGFSKGAIEISGTFDKVKPIAELVAKETGLTVKIR